MTYTLYHRTLGPLDPGKQNGELIISQYFTTNDPVVRDLAIAEYMPLVKYILNQIYIPASNTITVDDLRQSGLVGLVKAINRFNPHRGIKFNTFAYKYIQGAIIDCIRSARFLPRWVFDESMDLISSIEKLTQELGREPHQFEICEALNISPEVLSNRLKNCKNAWQMKSLNDSVLNSRDDSVSYIDLLEDRVQTAEDKYIESKTHEEIKNLISELPERDSIVMTLYYYGQSTLEEIGQILDLSAGRVHQIKKRVCRTLARKLN